MKIEKYLANLGYGSRREVVALLKQGRVTRNDGSRICAGDPVNHLEIRVDNAALDPAPGAVVMLHKPIGYVCSTKEASRLIYELLPPRFLKRSPIMAPVGRLDRETSGLLLLTDDGQINHRLTSPRRHISKTYEVELSADLHGDESSLFGSGTLRLLSETTPLLPATLEVLGPRSVRVTIAEGRYHQVRRMFAAVGNHVTTLHRVRIGQLQLGDLTSGNWRTLTPNELPSAL